MKGEINTHWGKKKIAQKVKNLVKGHDLMNLIIPSL